MKAFLDILCKDHENPEKCKLELSNGKSRESIDKKGRDFVGYLIFKMIEDAEKEEDTSLQSMAESFCGLSLKNPKESEFKKCMSEFNNGLVEKNRMGIP